MKFHKASGLGFFLLCISLASSALIYYPELPVDTATLFKAQIALDNWQKDLNKTYGTRQENPARTKQLTDLVVGQLMEMKRQLNAYNNVILGTQNGVSG
jgi:hypothetical protein